MPVMSYPANWIFASLRKQHGPVNTVLESKCSDVSSAGDVVKYPWENHIFSVYSG